MPRQPSANYAAILRDLEDLLKGMDAVIVDPDAFELWHPKVASLLSINPKERQIFQREAGMISEWGANHLFSEQSPKTIKTIIRTAIEDLRGKLRDSQPEQRVQPAPVKKTTISLSLFISHSSKDKELAAALATLLKSAFSLTADKIRCSSSDGYLLPAGVKTDEQLHKDVGDCHVLIGLLTPNALKSVYVLFELGARWGLTLPMVPVFARGVTHEMVTGPLAGITSLALTETGHIYKLIKQLGDILEVRPDAPDVYQPEIAKVTQLAAEVSVDITAQSSATDTTTKLSEAEVNILGQIAVCGGSMETTREALAQRFDVPLERMNMHLDHMLEAKLVKESREQSLGMIPISFFVFRLTQPGRIEAHKRGLI